MTDTSALAELDVAVAELLVRTGLPTGAPDLLNTVAQLLDLEVRQHTGIAEGRLCLRDGRAVIEIHPLAGASRRRFTLAHELGHAFLLHPRRPLSGAVCRRWPSEEAFCNDFAAALLLPRGWLEDQLSGSPASLSLLREIAQRSGTSLSASSLRLVRTGLWSHTLLEWRQDRDVMRLRSRGPLDHRIGARLSIDNATLRTLSLRSTNEGDGDVWRVLRIREGDRPRKIWAQIHAWERGLLALVGLRSDHRGRTMLAWHTLSSAERVET